MRQRRTVKHELREPLDLLTGVYKLYQDHQADRSYHRRTSLQTNDSAAHDDESSAVDEQEELISSLTQLLTGQVSSNDVMVELRGFEPLTPSMRTRCATGLRYSPKTGSQRTKPQPYLARQNFKTMIMAPCTGQSRPAPRRGGLTTTGVPCCYWGSNGGTPLLLAQPAEPVMPLCEAAEAAGASGASGG